MLLIGIVLLTTWANSMADICHSSEAPYEVGRDLHCDDSWFSEILQFQATLTCRIHPSGRPPGILAATQPSLLRNGDALSTTSSGVNETDHPAETKADGGAEETWSVSARQGFDGVAMKRKSKAVSEKDDEPNM